MNWDLVKDLPDHMIAVYYLDGKKFIQLYGKFRQIVKHNYFSYTDDYEFIQIDSANFPGHAFRRDELIFFVKDQP